tara:strand:+ start:506 stop:733 length:228 start_codon:yes stop_codon:yes gene_type:complete
MGRQLPFKNRNRMITLPKYKQNLRIEGDDVWSYITKVARIEGNELHQLGYWSMTTQKHINYVADYLDLILIKDYN